MSARPLDRPTTGFRLGWWILFGIAVLSILNHAVLVFTIPEEAVLFVGWSGLSAYAALVLWRPYRNREPWAWYGTWVFIACFAVLLPLGAEIGLYYLVAAVLMAAAQLLTRASFFAIDRA